MKVITLGTSHGDPTVTRFNSSTLFRIGTADYLVDAGAPVNALLIRRNIPLSALRAVFITHQHEDHIGGLPGLIKSLVKYPVPGQHTTIYLPEPGGIDGIMAFMRATHRGWPPDLLSFQVITPGVFHQDDQVRLTAIPTRHLENESMSFPSFGFLLEAEGRRVVYTGDLKADFSDFPASAFTGPTTCICECTHFPLDEGLSILRALPITRLICNHVDNIWHGPDGEAAFHRLTASLPFPVALAHDGDTFDIEDATTCFV